MSNKCIVTYADGAHEELLDVAIPTYKVFAHKHNYDFVVGKRMTDLPPAWNKIPLLLSALSNYDEVVWFDCDMVVVDSSEDFPSMVGNKGDGVFTQDKLHSMVRHFEGCSEVPNSGVWRLRRESCGLLASDLLISILGLEVFRNHGWWEQAALMTLMGYCVPVEGSSFDDTKCRNLFKTRWYNSCQFMRLSWNNHPNYRSECPRIIHCSYPDMQRRIEVMRALVKDPHYNYPQYSVTNNKKEAVERKTP